MIRTGHEAYCARKPRLSPGQGVRDLTRGRVPAAVVSLGSLKAESGTASPGCGPRGVAELVLGQWSEGRARSRKECWSPPFTS